MTKNPLINASLAALYIGVVASIFYFGSTIIKPVDSVLDPMVALSTLTLSAAVMAFLFFYQPVTLISRGEHSAALKFLLSTIGYFAIITALFVCLLAVVR